MIHEPPELTPAGLHEGVERLPQWAGRSRSDSDAYRDLPAFITRTASKQAYYTIRYLVDPDRRPAAYHAYAYFRWLDDRLDQPVSKRAERLAFLERQQALVDWAYQSFPEKQKRTWCDLVPQEHLLVDLIHSDDQHAGGLRSYIDNMMAVMAFDARRRGRLVTERELAGYTAHLAVAVTDALHYFIGHTHAPPESKARYLPAMAAHITHMLRDTYEDIELGYFNIPAELLESGGAGARSIESAPFRDWVSCRVHLARAYLKDGADYLDQVQSWRCRLAGYAYMARFTGVLDTIEREGYRLRPRYPEFGQPRYALKVGSSVLLYTILRGQP
jgi:phytoene/squalene synthetase